MAERQELSERFGLVASRLLTDMICPRLQMLAGLFANSRLTLADGVTTHRSVCCFDHTPEFPASTKLEIDVSPDEATRCAVIRYSLEILPVFFQFDRTGQLVVPLDEVNDESVSSWLDSKLLDFTDTYLRLQFTDQYQQENKAIDPVCGMGLNRAHAAASLEYQGKTYYFCVDDCRQKFLQEPERYLTHS